MSMLIATFAVLLPFGAAAGLIWFMASGKKKEDVAESEEG